MSSTPRLRLASPQPLVAPSDPGSDLLSPQLLDNSSRSGKRRTVLLSFDELPEWHQDNEFILHGYRPISGSAKGSLRSWTYVHNESVNIFSHLIPAVVFLLGEFYILEYLNSRYSDLTWADYFIFAFFLLTAVTCLGLSATYHTLANHSSEVDQLFLRLDLVGIVLLTLGDFVSGIYMVFWCEPLQRKIYWSMIAVLGSLTILIMLSPRFQGKEFRAFRVFAFVSTGLSGFAPLIHGVTMFGLSQMMRQSGMPYYLAEGGFLLLGVLTYATRFPECRYPGKFDLYGSSHQLFHILVVFATVTQLTGLLDAFDYNYTHRTCSNP